MPLFTRRKKQAQVQDESALLQLDEWGGTPLHNACEEGDFEHAKAVCESLSKSNLLKKVLLMKNEEGKTPIDLAIDAAGDSDTGDASLKLLLAAYIGQLNMMPELFDKSQQDKDKGIWELAGFKLPQLGHLLVADESSKLCDSETGDELLESDDDYKAFLNEYAELPHEGIGLIVANAFMAEYGEKLKWELEEPKPWEQVGGTYGCSSKLGAVLEKCCMLAQDALEAADKCQREYRSTEENKFRELSGRVQAAAATALDNLGNDIAYSIGCSVEGDRALNLACQSQQNVLLSSGAVVGVIKRKWRGYWLHKILDRTDESLVKDVFWSAYLGLLIFVNVLLLPLAAVAPGLAKHRDFGFGKMFPIGGYLLQTAYFQAGVFAGSDFCLTLALTAFQGTSWAYSIFVWASAALVYELQQVTSRKTSRSSSSLTSTFRSYLKQDPFNVLDVTALIFCVMALFCWCLKKLKDVSEGSNRMEAAAASMVQGLQDTTMDQVTIAAQTIGSVAVLLMWLRQLRLLMIVSSDMAPLVRMMGGMLNDVLMFLQLLLLVLFGFAGALSTLYNGETGAGLPEGCEDVIGTNADYFSILKILFEGSLLAESPFLECVKESQHPTGGLTLTYLFLILAVVLLLNMIIAMMGKTFDRYYEAAQMEAAAQFAGIVQDWEGQTDLPAPFNVFSLPYLAFSMCGLFSWCEREGDGGSTKGVKIYKSQVKSHEMPADDDSSENKALRILRLGDLPGGKADMEELKDMIADRLQLMYGEHEDTGTLIDNAVKNINGRMEDLEELLNKAVAASQEAVAAAASSKSKN